MNKKKQEAPEQTEEVREEAGKEKETVKEPTELEKAQQAQAQEHDQYLRLAAEYDNYRKRSQREKGAIYRDAVADTAKKFLPVYDNLQRALKNETADEAFKKGVEMTMTELTKIMESVGIKPFGAAGEPFDPEKHNAVMHVDDESLGENTVAEVFQTGFTLGEKVIRFAMVKVAN
ncbi:MAG: nucleotide exchange factor GrpE [Oscillospiraceae bacterium]|nr:nucleotide exchange factor GrpE [Oscillospiraceae bacterium]